MTPWLLRLYAVLLVAVPASARTDEMFTVTPQSNVALGDGGDSFGMEPVRRQEVVILLNPSGEDCTLRFPLRAGDAFHMFVRAGLDQKLDCEVSLRTIGKGQSATFMSRCVTAESEGAQRCPAP